MRYALLADVPNNNKTLRTNGSYVKRKYDASLQKTRNTQHTSLSSLF